MAKKPDPKDLLLLALYAEFNKPSGDYRLVTARLLDMEQEVWLWSLMCLRTEGLVDGVKWIPPRAASAADVLALHVDKMHMTREGVDYARELAGVDGRNRQEALRRLLDIFVSCGLTAISDMLRRCI